MGPGGRAEPQGNQVVRSRGSAADPECRRPRSVIRHPDGLHLFAEHDDQENQPASGEARVSGQNLPQPAASFLHVVIPNPVMTRMTARY